MYPDSRIPKLPPTEPTLPAVPPVEQIEEPNLIPPVPPAIKPIESASESRDWRQSKRIVSAASSVGSTPFLSPMIGRDAGTPKSDVEFTTSREVIEWSQPVEISEEIAPVQARPLFETPPEKVKALPPRSATAVSAPTGVPPSQQFYRSLQAEASQH